MEKKKTNDFMIGTAEYKLNHEIEEKENEYIIKIKMTVKKGSQTEKEMKECLKNNTSPIIKILGEHEKEWKKDIKEEKRIKGMYDSNI